MIYFTSDLHIGHDKDFIYEARGFSSIEEHDKEILKRWNEVVWPEDTVYILGDLCMGGNEKEWNSIYYNLNGTIKFIRGNHDTVNKINRYVNEYGIGDLGLASIYKYSKRRTFYLSHYPTFVANHEEDKFFWCLSGHTHSKDSFQYGHYCVYNVAVDAHEGYPVSIEQIIKDIEKYRQNINKEKNKT